VVTTKQMSKFLAKFSCLARGDLVAASLIHTAAAAPQGKAVDDVLGSPVALDDDAAAGGGKAAAAVADDAAADGSSGKQGKKKKQGSKQQQQDAAAAPSTKAAAAHGEEEPEVLMPKTLHIQDALRTLVREFFGRMPGGKCANCGGLNPSIKRQGCSKLFKQYSRRALLQNFARGMDVAAAVAGGTAAAAAAQQKLAEAAAAAAAVRKAGKQAAAAADADDGKADSKKRKRAAAAAAKQQQEEDGTAEDAAEQAAKKLQVAQGLAAAAGATVTWEDVKGAPSSLKKQEGEEDDWMVSWVCVDVGCCAACASITACVRGLDDDNSCMPHGAS
jgi:hypothetical protein